MLTVKAQGAASVNPVVNMPVKQGNIVHYIADSTGKSYAAIVVKVRDKVDGVVNLAVFPDLTEMPIRMAWEAGVPYADPGEGKRGTWHWA